MMNRILIIGQSFSTIRTQGTPAFANDYSGRRLRSWFGFEDLEVFYEALRGGCYLTTNLVLEQKDKINNREIDKKRIRAIINDYKPTITVYVGMRVKEYMLWEFELLPYVYIPHPSTRNRLSENKDGEIIELLTQHGLRYSQNSGG